MSHPLNEDWKEICGCVWFWGGLNNTDKTDSDVSEHPACCYLAAFKALFLNHRTATFRS
jgi:hypothetical protein